MVFYFLTQFALVAFMLSIFFFLLYLIINEAADKKAVWAPETTEKLPEKLAYNTPGFENKLIYSVVPYRQCSASLCYNLNAIRISHKTILSYEAWNWFVILGNPTWDVSRLCKCMILRLFLFLSNADRSDLSAVTGEPFIGKLNLQKQISDVSLPCTIFWKNKEL